MLNSVRSWPSIIRACVGVSLGACVLTGSWAYASPTEPIANQSCQYAVPVGGGTVIVTWECFGPGCTCGTAGVNLNEQGEYQGTWAVCNGSGCV